MGYLKVASLLLIRRALLFTRPRRRLKVLGPERLRICRMPPFREDTLSSIVLSSPTFPHREETYIFPPTRPSHHHHHLTCDDHACVRIFSGKTLASFPYTTPAPAHFLLPSSIIIISHRRRYPKIPAAEMVAAPVLRSRVIEQQKVFFPSLFTTLSYCM